MRSPSVRSATAALAAVTVGPLAFAAVVPSAASAAPPGTPAPAAAAPGAAAPGAAAPATYVVNQILSGTLLSHTFIPSGSTTPVTDPLSDPDDITLLGRDLVVGFQDGVGPQGQAAPDGNVSSTIVELAPSGRPLGQWDVVGKADGVTADPITGDVIATVNEDANSSLWTIDPHAPASAQVVHYAYAEPLPSDGGTDAISVSRGQILISGSAPGTTGAAAPQAVYPAVYAVSLAPTTRVASVSPLFGDEAPATVANVGAQAGQGTTLGLTDPDSNEVVPAGARFGGDLMVTSQGDQEQIFVAGAGTAHQALSVLSLSQSVDDTAWPTTPRGSLYSTDSANDTVDRVRGPFVPGRPLAVATPCGANSAPATCPAPPTYPANFLGTVDPDTGQVSPVATVGAAYTPEGGLVFVPGRAGGSGDGSQAG